jgi:hypothetical protein
VGKYYYIPFEKTDKNERAAWNICLSWGARFADTTLTPDKYLETEESFDVSLDGSVKLIKIRKYYTPQKMAYSLMMDGLRNVEINVRLLCCFGGGVFGADSTAQSLNLTSGMPLTPLAQRLALELGKIFEVSQAVQSRLRVAGYVGATNSNKGDGCFYVDVNANKKYEKADNHVRWYDLTGRELPEGNPEGNDLAQAGMRGLFNLKVGDALYIMAHGDWKSGGRFLPVPGETGLGQTAEVVNRAERMAGNAAVVDNAYTMTTATNRFGLRALRSTDRAAQQTNPKKNCIIVDMPEGESLHIYAFDEQGRCCVSWDESRVQLSGDQSKSLEWLKTWFSDPSKDTPQRGGQARTRAMKLTGLSK